jgi:hypothetical protein
VCLEKAPPGAVLAADRCGIKSVAVADVVDRRIAQRVSQIVQGTDDAVTAPGRVFFDQLDDELFKFRIHGWSTERICPGKGPLLGDEDTEPAEQGVGSHEGGELPKAVPADELGFASESSSLGVGEAPGFAAELCEENAIFFLEVFDDRLLVSVHPAGDGNEEELKLSCHGGRKHSKVPAAQSVKWPRLIFLATQGATTARRGDAIRFGATDLQAGVLVAPGGTQRNTFAFLTSALASSTDFWGVAQYGRTRPNPCRFSIPALPPRCVGHCDIIRS